MPGEPIGCMLDLRDLDGGGPYLDEAYVRGHVDDATFRAAVADHLGGELDEELPGVPAYGPIRHVWARWEFSGLDDYGDRQRTLAEHRHRGRGCFPVTAATLQSTLDMIAATKAQGDRDVAELLARYPGVEVIRRNDYGRDYLLRVPGVEHEVRAGWRDWREYHARQGRPAEVTLAIWPHGADIPAWNAFRATCPDFQEVSRVVHPE